MPHFVIDCSQDVLDCYAENEILERVYMIANSTELFEPDDIKVRLNPFKNFIVGNKETNFIHVFTSIMEGRSDAQKSELSSKVVQELTSMFPHISKIAMNVDDFKKAGYCNREML